MCSACLKRKKIVALVQNTSLKLCEKCYDELKTLGQIKVADFILKKHRKAKLKKLLS